MDGGWRPATEGNDDRYLYAATIGQCSEAKFGHAGRNLERAQRGGCDVSAVAEFDYEGSEMKSDRRRDEASGRAPSQRANSYVDL